MQKRIYRSRNDRIIAGICSGIAKYFEIDPAIVRIIFLLLFFFKGIGIIAYFIMWIVIPAEPYESKVYNMGTGGKPYEENSDVDVEEAEIIEEKTNENSDTKHAPENPKKDNRYTIGIILIILGGIFLLEQIFPQISMEIFFPIILIGVGAYLLLNAQNGGTQK